jgi:hypothetical protein
MGQRPRTLGGLVDELVLSVTIVFESKRGFVDTKPGPPAEFADLLAEVKAAPPVIHWGQTKTLRGRRRVPADLPAVGGATYFDRFPAKGTADTLVVYHHGLGEIPHDMVPRLLRLNRRLTERCDVIAVKGLHHEKWADVSAHLTSDRDVFLSSLMASASLVRAIGKALHSEYTHLVLCGMSMGGVISLIEACREPTYDLYVPFIAGPDLRDVLFRSYFARTIQSAWRKRAEGADWVDRLDMTDRLAGCEGPPIRPLLAKSDRLFRSEVQAAAYARVPRARVAFSPGGHITGAARLHLVARHLVSNIREVCWTAAPASAPRETASV